MQCFHRIAAPPRGLPAVWPLRRTAGCHKACVRGRASAATWQQACGTPSAYQVCLRTASIPTRLPLQGELELSGRNVALLWDFDNIRPPGGARAAAHAVHLLQVCGQTSMSGALIPAAGLRHYCSSRMTGSQS